MSVVDQFALAGKVALITGGSRGLGLGMARALGDAGARVAISARKQDELEAAVAELRREGYDVTGVCNDVGDRNGPRQLVDRVLASLGQIDVLICNAGATWGAPSVEVTPKAWDKVMNVNLRGTWLLCQAVAALSMLPRGRGNIIIVASVAGLGGNAPGTPATVTYNTSKAAQINLTRALAAEWGSAGIRVNALLPGWFTTKMTRDTLEHHGNDFLKRIPLGRLGSSEEDLAGPVLFLASDASRYVTGHALVVDGGMTAVV